MEILVIDDERSFPRHFSGNIIYARNSRDAVSLLRRRQFSQVWFDHDLGEDDDIRPVIRWIEEHLPTIGHCYVHTMNPVGSKWIRVALENAGYRVSLTRNPHLKVQQDAYRS